MHLIAKQVLRDAGLSEHYWNLSDAEKLTWLIERAYTIGVAAAPQPSPTLSEPPVVRHRRPTYRKERP